MFNLLFCVFINLTTFITNTVESWINPGFGIFKYATQGHKAVRENLLGDLSFSSPGQFVAMCFSDNMMPQAITCNTVNWAHTGFRFWGNNICDWTGNKMQNTDIGLHLTGAPFGPTGPTMIGQQGIVGVASSGNEWINNNTDTQVDAGTNPAQSALVITQGAPFEPFINTGPQPYIGGWPFAPLMLTNSPYPGCAMVPSNLIPRLAHPTGVTTQNTEQQYQLDLYPNPSSGNVGILGLNGVEDSEIKFSDVTGKQVYSKILGPTDGDNINVSSIPNGIYLVEIQNGSRKEVKKLVLSK